MAFFPLCNNIQPFLEMESNKISKEFDPMKINFKLIRLY